jgi:tRNA pseudouridine38-40 synthase
MARYKAIVAYDGTRYQGFQRQLNARTVQAELETALEQIGWHNGWFAASGRTDTGVHASGQVIAFDLEWRHSMEDLLRAINANLPADIALQEVEISAADFHPRFSALSRRYQYRIFCRPVRQPLRERFAWRVWPGVKPELLDRAASYLPGEHDFASFGSPPQPGTTTLRQIYSAGWQEQGQDLVFYIVGNAFLYRMVRRLVAFQVEIGQGLREPDELEEFLNLQSEKPALGLAPPHGLTLVEVIYPSSSDE